jgi:putative hydrolase of the HAD superfamily
MSPCCVTTLQYLGGSVPMSLPEAIIFDLDDTLYLERDFVMSGFRAVAKWMSEKTGVQGFDLTCKSLFDNGQRTKIFDAALVHHEQSTEVVEALVEIYRNHSPEIALATDAAKYLAIAPTVQRFGLITDGHLATQRAKIRRLKLEQIFDVIVCTDVWGKPYWKPHVISFETVERHFNLSGASLAYIADNPSKDFLTPKARGWCTVQICRQERANKIDAPNEEYQAHAFLPTFDGLNGCLAKVFGSLVQTRMPI